MDLGIHENECLKVLKEFTKVCIALEIVVR